MSNPAWGLKRICPNCATRYYDFKKDPPACPSCGTEYDPEALLKSRRTRAVANDEPVKTRKKAAAKVATDEDAPLVDADEEIDAAIEEEEVEVEEAEVVEGGDEILEDDDDAEIELEDVEVEEEEN